MNHQNKKSNRPNSQRQSSLQQSKYNGTKSAAGQFAHALVNSDEMTLDRMARYSAGAIGSSQNNVSKLQQIGATGVGTIMTNGRQATVTFMKNGEPACIGIFDVIDNRYVEGDWKLFIPA